MAPPVIESSVCLEVDKSTIDSIDTRNEVIVDQAKINSDILLNTESSSSVNNEEKEGSLNNPSSVGQRLYEQGMTQLEKLEQQRKLPPEECTFAPKVLSKCHNRNTNSPSDCFENLYANAKQSKEKMEARRQAQTPIYSFKPKITDKGRRKSIETENSISRFESLYHDAAKLQEKMKTMREVREVEGCTFKPKITSKAKKIINTGKSQTNRLYDNQKFLEKKEILEKKRVEKELEECTFKPNILIGSHSIKEEKKESIPLYERLQSSLKLREEKVNRMREELEKKERDEETFCPKVNHKVLSTKNIEDQGNIYDRLYKKGNLLAIEADRETKRRQEEMQYSFKPTISKRSASVGKLRPNDHTPIHERLFHERTLKEKQLAEREALRLQQEMQGCTFSPQVAAFKSKENSIENAEGQEKSCPTIWERLHSISSEKKSPLFKQNSNTKRNILNLSSPKPEQAVEDDTKITKIDESQDQKLFHKTEHAIDKANIRPSSARTSETTKTNLNLSQEHIKLKKGEENQRQTIKKSGQNDKTSPKIQTKLKKEKENQLQKEDESDQKDKTSPKIQTKPKKENENQLKREEVSDPKGKTMNKLQFNSSSVQRHPLAVDVDEEGLDKHCSDIPSPTSCKTISPVYSPF